MFTTDISLLSAAHGLMNGYTPPAKTALGKRLLLSKREQQILQGMANGLSTKMMAQEFSISEDTIETHRRNLFRKMKAKNSNHAIAIGFRNRLIK